MKKRNKTCLLSALLAVCMLTACGGEQAKDKLLDKNAPVTLTIWHYYNGIQQTQFDELVKEFNDTIGSEKGIFVDAVSQNSVDELAKNVLASVKREPGAQDTPDIFATYVETAYQVDKLGMLADMKQYFTDEELDEYVSEYMQEGAFDGDGTLKIFPTAKSTEVMMINETDWAPFAESAGVTYDDLSTWEGLVAVSEKYYDYTDALTPDVPNDGRAFFGRDSVANYMIVGAKQLGHPFVEKAADGTVTVSTDKETVKKLWESFYVPYVKGYFDSESRFRSDDARIGQIIALVCSTTGATYYPEEVTIDDEYTYPIENEVLPVPNFEGCDPYIVQQGAGMSVIKSDEKTEYACAVFLKWFTEKEQNISFSVNSGYLPVKKEANDTSVIFAQENEQEISATMKNTLQTAIDELQTCTLYVSLPYDHSAAMRDYISNVIEDTAKRDQEAVQSRTAAGEDRETVLCEYTSDEAYESWYAQFEQGFHEIAGE